MNILITGSSGYIGSHTCLELLKKGFNIVGIDNFSNSSPLVRQRVQRLAGRSFDFFEIDVCDSLALSNVFKSYRFDAVIHFAGLKSVSESLCKSVSYYWNNVYGTLNLLSCMSASGVRRLVFSSSATVYGDPNFVPIPESAPLRALNPYGSSKLMAETILGDCVKSGLLAKQPWSVCLLRYFNPVGAHESGQIGEDPNGVPNNLMPYISQVAIGKLDYLRIFGNDYDTHDGTGVRDYIHVVDLAMGHVNALEKMLSTNGLLTLNLGTGSGSSVLDVVAAFERATGRRVPYKFLPRREGDSSICVADANLAKLELGWVPNYDLDDMCASAWAWQSKNPNGYSNN